MNGAHSRTYRKGGKLGNGCGGTFPLVKLQSGQQENARRGGQNYLDD